MSSVALGSSWREAGRRREGGGGGGGRRIPAVY